MEDSIPAVLFIRITCVRALCVAGSVLAASAAHAQAPGAPAPAAPQAAPADAPPPPAPEVIRLEISAPPTTPAPTGPELAEPAGGLVVAPAAARESEGLSPTFFWIAASATIITASLGGFYAQHVRDMYDEASLLNSLSPRQAQLHDQMQRAEVTADVLFVSSLVLAVGTTILAFHVDWSGAERIQARAARAPRRVWW